MLQEHAEQLQQLGSKHTQDIFLVEQIKQAAPYHSSVIALNTRTSQYFKLSCYGSCPMFSSGEYWSLRYRVLLKASRYCHTFFCAAAYQTVARARIDGRRARYVKKRHSGFFQRAHERYIQLLSSWFADSTVVSVFSALTLNDKRGFDSKLYNIFRRTGTSHLLALSGLHIALMVGLLSELVLFLLAFVCPGYLSRYTSIFRFLCVLLLGSALFQLTYSSYSIDRALGLFMISTLSVLSFRYFSPQKILLYVFLLLLFIDPFMIFSVGAWLSFQAVFCLIFIARHARSVLKAMWFDPLSQVLLFFCLAPLSMYFFHAVSWVSPLVNAVAIPWFGLTVIPCLTLSLFSSLLSVHVAHFFAYLAWLFFVPVFELMHRLASFPSLIWRMQDCPLPLVLLVFGVILWVSRIMLRYCLGVQEQRPLL